MFRAHLRLIAAFLVLGIVGGGGHRDVLCLAQLPPAISASPAGEILALEKDPPKRIDVGARVFNEAMDLMLRGEVAAAHAQLSGLVKTYTDSEAYSKSRRILGEVNMDRLLSDVRTPGKVDYVVKSGDSLNKIAAQQKTTVDYIIMANNLQGLTLQRGDKLVVCPLDFSVNVSLSEKTVTLLQDGKFFKEYPIRVARNTREADTKLESRSAFANGRAILVGREGYVGSEKWLSCGKGRHLWTVHGGDARR